MGIFTRKNNPYAYRGKLTCPVCQSEAVRFVENITPHRMRYRCRKCGLPFQYDTAYSAPGMPGGNHPYAPFMKKSNKWRDIIAIGQRSRRTNEKEK